MSTEDLSAYAEDAETNIGDNSMARLQGLAAEQEAAEQYVADCETLLEKAKKELNAISAAGGTLPTLMEELGLEDFTTESGLKIKIKSDVTASTTGKYQKPILKWLDDTGNDKLTKKFILVELPKGDDHEKTIKGFMKLAEVNGLVATVEKSIHPMTFKALIRRCLADGIKVPMDKLGIQQWSKSVIDKPSKGD